MKNLKLQERDNVRSEAVPGEVSPRVSVVVPCYNYGKLLPEAIESILASTYENIEIIVVDDGPTDPFTIKLLKNINYPKTRVIFQKNQGLAVARNNGINAATGRYVLPLDADDRIDPTYIEKAVTVLENDADTAVVYGMTKVFGRQDFVWENSEYNLRMMRKGNIMPSCSMFRRSAWEAVGGYEPDRDQYDDWTFWVKLAYNGFFGRRIPEVLFYHRKHDGEDSMSDGMVARHAEYVRKIRMKFPEFFSGQGITRSVAYNIGSSSVSYFAKLRHLLISSAPACVRDRYFFIKSKAVNLGPMTSLRKFFRRKSPFRTGFRLHGHNLRKRRVMLFLPWLSRGGVEKVSEDLILGMADTTFIVITTSSAPYDADADLAFKKITPFVYHLPNFLQPRDFLAFVKSCVKSFDVDTCVINHSEWAYANISSLRKMVRCFDIVHNAAREGYGRHSMQNRKFLDRTIIISDSVAERLAGQGRKKAELVVIGNGVDVDKTFNPELHDREGMRRSMNLSTDDFAVLFLGRLSQEKNPQKFLEIADSFADMQSVKFIIAGDGPLGGWLDRHMRSRGMGRGDRVRHLGSVGNPASVLSACDLLVNTSDIEGLPLTIIESLSMGVPVIAQDIGGIRDVITSEKYGTLLAPHADGAAYTAAVRKYVDGFARSFDGEAARLWVKERFSRDRMIDGYRRVLS